ncbi:hypothetical protein AYI68_g732 [Smittium mucronatum]|uniref:Uncharacterized protein n=1 Tax=Smittium mucronatum TaxID=133383 RepID=A0A1R0H7L5_9FUNG|nr:hypothetical protein AYI68_g732 [Smittium mucronatum]
MYKGLFLGMFVGALISRIQTANCVAYGNVISNLQEAASLTYDWRNVSYPKFYKRTYGVNNENISYISDEDESPQSLDVVLSDGSDSYSHRLNVLKYFISDYE